VVDDRIGRPKARRWRRRVLLCLTAACLAAAATSIAAQSGRDSGPERARASATLRAPALMAPANEAVVNAVPAFSWRPVRKAAKYEFQFASDAGFRSTLASYETLNTAATVDDTVFDGNYYWRVRAISALDKAGRWSAPQLLKKRWTTPVELQTPAQDSTITYPADRLVLRWSEVPHAFKYEVVLSSDPSLAGNLLADPGKPSTEVPGTSLAVTRTLSDGQRYYWAVTPIDGGGLKGPRSAVGSFVWSWPSSTQPHLVDLFGDADQTTYVDPQFSWDPVPGAARYEVEVNSSSDFASGSKICCSDPTTGTSLSPTKLLPNNTDLPGAQEGYHWRVRALDLDGNAGVWNVGQVFRKAFDDVVPSVPNVRIRDNLGNDLNLGETTSAPILDWDPVPGASSYEVRVVPWRSVSPVGCNWTASILESWGSPAPVDVSGTAWTPLAYQLSTPVPFGDPAREIDKLAPPSPPYGGYCARVRARAGADTTNKRVVSDWTTLGDESGPAFVYNEPTVPGSATTLLPDDYVFPLENETLHSMPLFTWYEMPEACGYFIAVATDENFTDVVDVARTKIAAYAPRLRTYPDETTSYWYAVMPVYKTGTACDFTPSVPEDNSPQTFQKRSNPPNLLTPAGGADLGDQPTFRWKGNWVGANSVEAAREYQLQVATDPTFANPIDNVKTASTAYTSSSTYPADTAIYWRVRANDENGTGLTWSNTGTFRRVLGVPVPSADNPTRGQSFPVLSWSPVQGAVSYDVHLEEEDGDKRDFTGFRSTAVSFTRLTGLGVLRWQVRANFPKLPFGTVPGGWSPAQTFDRFIDPPPGASMSSNSKRVLLTWDASPAAKKYKAEFSDTSSFSRIVDSHITSNTNYAPRLTQLGFLNGGVLYWRVAALDEDNNVGGWATGTFKLPRAMRVVVAGFLMKRKRGVVTVTVQTIKGQAIKRARVKVRGAGVRARPKRTRRGGIVKFRLRARRAGNVTFTVSKRGYRTGKAVLQVR
jgi:hypothetical protein